MSSVGSKLGAHIGSVWVYEVYNRRFGGTCVNNGCMPTMVASVYMAHLASRAADYGVLVGTPIGVDIKRIVARKNNVSDTARMNLEAWLRSMSNARCCGAMRVS
jgi:pyruvate/2-oxoglutarate dehydrogenase complex dihydrolipoamide dehydrogenase (E3) component